MGLFKKKESPYNPEQVAENKKKMRELFNDAVENGAEYQVLKMYTSSSSIETGFVWDTRTTTFRFFLVGYRETDPRLVLVPINVELTQHGNPSIVDLQEMKGANYYRKIQQLSMTKKKEAMRNNETGFYIFNIGDSSENSLYIKNVRQEEERQGLLTLAEKYFPIKYKK